MSKDFGKTLNLPKTEFSMRANLPQREPATQEKDTTSGTKPEELVTDSETAGGDSDDGCFGIISGSAVLMSCIMIAGGAWICSSRKKKQD